MLNPKNYNIETLKKMGKSHFFKAYKGKMYNIQAVWEWLHPPANKRKVGVKSTGLSTKKDAKPLD